MHHSDAVRTTLHQAGREMGKLVEPNRQPKRVTVTLEPGQYDQLVAIAKANKATLAYVVRRAVTQFIESGGDRQLRLKFPADL